jgi:flagellar hook-associated protein 1 FlgK
MSLSSAMNATLSGLTVSARMAELVSSNVANAMTPGYVRRTAELAARETGGQGVRLVAILRTADMHLLSERRMAQAGEAGASARAAFLAVAEHAVGTADTSSSLSARVNALDSALLAAAGRPDSDVRLGAVVDAAAALTNHLGAASATIQTARATADSRIASQVGRLNDALAQIADLNTRIQIGSIAGQDTSALLDLRQQQIDSVAEILPIREVARADGAVALFTPGGASLLEGSPSVFGFTPHPVVTADMTQENGALSGLTLNGRAIATGPGSFIDGGGLAAQFAIRDESAPAAQASLDGLARDLIERFSGLDDSLPPDAPGGECSAGRGNVAAARWARRTLPGSGRRCHEAQRTSCCDDGRAPGQFARAAIGRPQSCNPRVGPDIRRCGGTPVRRLCAKLRSRPRQRPARAGTGWRCGHRSGNAIASDHRKHLVGQCARPSGAG